jgi:hypothetical protein
MWWTQLIQAVVQLGMQKAGQDAEKNQAQAYGRMARTEGGVAASLAMEEGARARARAATLAAASGGGITGSAQEVLDDLARQQMFRARSAIYSAETDARFGARVSGMAGMVGAGAQAVAPLLSEWASGWKSRTGQQDTVSGGQLDHLGGMFGAGA